MATPLSTFFELTTQPTAEAAYYYQLIQDKPNSVECHKALVNVFAAALRLNSYRYRNANVPYTPAEIPDVATLDALLAHISADVKNPLVQVLFEQISSKTGTSNNSVLFPTSTDASTKTSLQTSVDAVNGIEYATFYNELRLPYVSLDWVVKLGTLPGEIANPGSGNIPPVATVKSALKTLSDWIQKNDPTLVYINKEKSLDAVQIIDSVFGATAVPLETFLFAETLLTRIRAMSGVKLENGMKAVNAFINIVQAAVGDVASIWQTSPSLKSLADEIVSVKKGSERNALVFGQTRELFKIGLGTPDLEANTKAAIINLLNNFAARGDTSSTFLLTRIKETFNILLEWVNPDPDTLNVWADEIDQAIPDFISTEDIEDLMTAACSALSSIPLKPVANFAANKIADARLFAFSDFSVINQHSDLVRYPPGTDGTETDIIQVWPDASENNDAYYRPTYAVIDNATDDAELKFFNVGATPGDGEFFFIDAGEPSRVLTQQTVAATTLEFNFKSATINNSKVVPATGVPGLPNVLAGTPYRTTTEAGSSSKVFYDVVKTISKWTELSGRRTYDVLYQTASGSAAPNAHLIWRLPPGGGLSRAESVDDSLVLWEWHGPSDCAFPNVGQFLNLPPARRIVRQGTSTTIAVGGIAYQVVEEVEKNINDIFYKFIQIVAAPNATPETYVLANTPHPNLPAAIDSALARGASKFAKIGNDSSEILGVMNFSYYRKAATDSTSNPKVIKWISKTGSPQRPVVGDGIKIDDTSVDYTVIGISLPVSFRLPQNVLQYKKLTGAGGAMQPSIKNKESSLHRAQGTRMDAGTVMQTLTSYLNNAPAVKSVLPATVFGNWAISRSTAALNLWRLLKDTARSTLPTNQEWCHIRGHGDGGDERLGNFVCGSFHCNTEQLAIESGQRITTQSFPKDTFKLLSTAYLFKNEAGVMLPNTNYLQSDAAYKAAVAVHSALKTRTGRAPSKDTGAGANIPFAAFFRYKVERNLGGDAREKVFDHIFEGQSEFMDVHQFNILCKTTEFALAGKDAFKEWYASEQDAFDEASADVTMQ